MLKIGIVGLPNVGKSTLFNALTRKSVDISNYPFCTIEPNVGIVEVPDERLGQLAALSHSKKIIPAAIEFVDIAGLVKDAAKGEGLGNKFLSHIRDVDAVVEVVRIFDDPDITHIYEKSDPILDIEIIEYELILKDIETVQKRIEAVERDIKGRKKGAEEELMLLKKWKLELEAGHILSSPNPDQHSNILENVGMSEKVSLLTQKPFIYIFNVSEEQIQNHWEPDEELKKKIDMRPYAAISARIESELSELSDEERKEYMASLGIEESGLDRLIKIGYETLGLITFLTTGEDETRAWTVLKNSKAPRAGRAIHSDFEEKFIRAEVINWQKLVEAGSYAKARELGLLRTEGKEYIVQDGDVIEFKI